MVFDWLAALTRTLRPPRRPAARGSGAVAPLEGLEPRELLTAAAALAEPPAVLVGPPALTAAERSSEAAGLQRLADALRQSAVWTAYFSSPPVFGGSTGWPTPTLAPSPATRADDGPPAPPPANVPPTGDAVAPAVPALPSTTPPPVEPEPPAPSLPAEAPAPATRPDTIHRPSASQTPAPAPTPREPAAPPAPAGREAPATPAEPPHPTAAPPGPATPTPFVAAPVGATAPAATARFAPAVGDAAPAVAASPAPVWVSGVAPGVVADRDGPAAGGRVTADAPDGALLRRFAGGDQAAFTELVRRHGRGVQAVCTRVLGDPARAEDAAQATFLALARRAGGLDPRESLGGWLYRVAARMALRCRATAARRRRVERAAAEQAEPPADAFHGVEVGDDCRAVQEELDRLPDKYRVPLVLCYLEGRTHAEVAHATGLPRGSVSKRIGEGLDRLREGLAVRGVRP